MPLERNRYPHNWETLSTTIKTAANWYCQNCGKPCRRPSESIADFSDRIADNSVWYSDLMEEICDEESGECALVPKNYQKFTLTTAHLDQNPANNSPQNLKAFCTICHLNHDRKFWWHNRYRKRERIGQIPLAL